MTVDPFYEEAVKVVRTHGTVRASTLQKNLRIGHNRAMGILETMEKNKIVGKARRDGSRNVMGV